MEKLETEIRNCTKCDLAKTRNKVVTGDGNAFANIMLIGEGPGFDEDKTGKPFVGKSGQLLDKILEACNFKRDVHLFISNIVKCRPPSNRVPTDAEVKTCIPFLYKQIELVNPKIIVTLGSTSLKCLTGDNSLKITKLHGQWLQWDNRLLMPVYHTSALLRNPALKRDTWEDFKKIILKYRELVDPNHPCEYV